MSDSNKPTTTICPADYIAFANWIADNQWEWYDEEEGWGNFVEPYFQTHQELVSLYLQHERQQEQKGTK